MLTAAERQLLRGLRKELGTINAKRSASRRPESGFQGRADQARTVGRSHSDRFRWSARRREAGLITRAVGGEHAAR